MKKIILSALIFSMAVSVKAQEITDRKTERPERHERKQGHDRHPGVDFKSLNLTEDQKEKFKTQNESFRKQVEELKKNDGITVKEWKTKMQNLRSEHKTKMQGLLTTDQKAKLENMKAEGKAKHETMSKERTEKMKTKLGLSDEQSLKLESSRKQLGEQMNAIRDNKSLDDAAKREKMAELRKKQKENMKSILTEEQLNKLKEAREQGHERKGKKPEKKETI